MDWFFYYTVLSYFHYDVYENQGRSSTLEVCEKWKAATTPFCLNPREIKKMHNPTHHHLLLNSNWTS